MRFPDGSVICRAKKATDTYIDSLVRIGLPAVNELNISARDNHFVNLVSNKPDRSNCTEVEGWYVFRKLDTKGMAKYLTKVSDKLGLGLGVDILENPEEDFRGGMPKMKVVLDGVEFCRNSCAATFAEAIRRLGEADVERLGMKVCRRNLVSRTGGEGYTPTGGGFLSGPRRPRRRKSSSWRRSRITSEEACMSTWDNNRYNKTSFYLP